MYSIFQQFDLFIYSSNVIFIVNWFGDSTFPLMSTYLLICFFLSALIFMCFLKFCFTSRVSLRLRVPPHSDRPFLRNGLISVESPGSGCSFWWRGDPSWLGRLWAVPQNIISSQQNQVIFPLRILFLFLLSFTHIWFLCSMLGQRAFFHCVLSLKRTWYLNIVWKVL